MKFQIPLVHVQRALDWLSGQFPGRGEEIARLGKRAQIGLELDVKPIRARHTKEQQGAYWASLHEFGRHLGYSAHETEEYLHPVICAETYGISGHRSIRCRGADYQWPVPRETSSKDADGNARDVETYSHLIDTLIRFAAEYGYVIEIRSPRAAGA